jgi:hypothetical protein
VRLYYVRPWPRVVARLGEHDIRVVVDLHLNQVAGACART